MGEAAVIFSTHVCETGGFVYLFNMKKPKKAFKQKLLVSETSKLELKSEYKVFVDGG